MPCAEFCCFPRRMHRVQPAVLLSIIQLTYCASIRQAFLNPQPPLLLRSFRPLFSTAVHIQRSLPRSSPAHPVSNPFPAFRTLPGGVAERRMSSLDATSDSFGKGYAPDQLGCAKLFSGPASRNCEPILVVMKTVMVRSCPESCPFGMTRALSQCLQCKWTRAS